MHKRKELRWSMIKVLTLVWLVPLMLLSIGMLIVMVNKNSKQIEETILVSTKKAIESSVNKMNTVIRASKDASYIPTIKESYQQYLKDGNKTQLYIDVTQFLNQQYRYNDMIQSTMLYFRRTF